MRSAAVAAVALIAVLVMATTGSAHIERASYWPNPAPDTSVSPPAGGKVPAARSLFTALKKSPPGRTRVVCAGKVPSQSKIKKARRKLRAARRHHASRATRRRLKKKLKKAKKSYAKRVARNRSIKALRQSISAARKRGWKVRPTERARKLSKRQARRLRKFNERLLARCKYHEIQPAVTRSRNNDRVLVMPGVYTEPTARAQPTNDPTCADLKEENDKGSTAAVSYRYQAKCPNDQNLIAVIGRETNGKPPQPPLDNRHGIPDQGRCIRCNFQLEGSGVGPDDVVVDAGRVASGNHAPIGAKKDVGIRADRADGFVMRNMTFRHAAEHDIYILESDGYRIERFKAFYAGEYGVLTFVEDHGLMQDCEAAGHGDSGLYPGAAAETGNGRASGPFRYNQEITRCDMHHNAAGYSGTDGNAVHLHHNNFYDNANGFTTDVFTASGHPGFPQDSDLLDHNNFYSNNFNPYLKGSDVVPTVPMPTGTGMWIAGGNDNVIRDNHFWNNWRRGAMLFAVPDALVCGPAAGGNEQHGCQPGIFSTSFRNRFYGNTMGRTPGGKVDPNGTDFWWDSFVGNTGNCWYGNKGRDGTAGSITTLPAGLPSNCGSSIGTGGPAQEAELLGCLAAFDQGIGDCPWFHTPAEPK